ncbi:MAG: zinc-ribbon domain-containing protein [Gammaproteobacteria bacterium]|nr:zinc-ribbon domain-containing protein [Gammaproteobacteria bacterium]
MYTQCPDCSTAFRVTAAVLKQAAGKVRCGGCGNAFNALEFLSETMPEQAGTGEPDSPVPELTAESDQSDDGGSISISAEQSAALMKTLEELEGPDIRIEDTGVEWRVLDEDEISETAVDELLDESPTPIDEFLTRTPSAVEEGEIFEESANAFAQTPVEELRFDDNTPLPDDFDLDDESSYLPESPEQDQSALEASAESDAEVELLDESEDTEVDIEFGEPEDWADILGEFDELSESDPATPDTEPAAVEDAEKLLDVDTQFALQAEAMGIDLSGIHQSPEHESNDAAAQFVDDEDQELATGPDDELDERVELEPDDEPGEEAGLEIEDEPGEDAEPEFDIEAEDEATGGHAVDEEADEGKAPLEFGTISAAMAELEDQSNVFDDDFFDDADALELELDDEIGDEDEPDLAASEETDFVIPPQSEEEQTLNLMIDEDLLSLAVEDEDGFASTIVVAKEDADAMDTGERERLSMEPNISTDFESIVLEGEFVHSALDMEKRETDMAAAAELAEQAKAARDAEKVTPAGSSSRMTVAIVALTVLILGQVMHQSRDALATIPAVNNVLGPVYQAIGKPLSPAWDVTGWTFEATQPKPDDDNEQLTVLSRIGNRSDDPLPYPLINVALIDRFEETIGSHTLDPADYLTNDLDPGALVQPGNTFTAVISIPSPAENATGYKLKVCYRLSAGRLRCNNPDFK